jgi:glycosyltransferase involved in cell wall biosynthesis
VVHGGDGTGSDPQRGLRIAHVYPVSIDLYGFRDDEWGSAYRSFLPNMTAAQVARGDHPTVHTLTTGRRGHTEVIEGVRVVFHPKVEPQPGGTVQRRFSRQVSPALLRALRRDAMDLVHFHGARSMHGPLALVVARAVQQHIPVVAQDHGPRSVGPFTRTLHRTALRRCAAILALNDASRDELRDIAPDVEMAQVANGVDRSLFHPGAGHDHASDPFRVLVVSRLMEDKDPLTGVEAIVAVAGRGHRIEVTVVGVGELRDAVAERLRAAGVPTTMIDKVRQPELADLYRRANVLLLSSLREGFNQATLEAMSCGTPVLASDIPGIRDGVGDAGLLVPAGDVGGFTAQLERLVTDPSAWREHQRRGIDRAARYTWPAIVEGIDAVYRRAIARGATGARRSSRCPEPPSAP